MRVAAFGFVLIASLGFGPSALAQITGVGPGRFVDVIEVEDHDDQADVVVQFTCSLRYITHQPAAEGKELRIQLQPLGDCQLAPGTQILGELPPVSGGAHIVDAARVESDVPGQVTLVFDFHKNERYVLAQGVDPRGLRLRLIDRARGRGKVMINEPSGPAATYAVNLESQPKRFHARDLAAGARPSQGAGLCQPGSGGRGNLVPAARRAVRQARRCRARPQSGARRLSARLAGDRRRGHRRGGRRRR